jgi:hypothetical protein
MEEKKSTSRRSLSPVDSISLTGTKRNKTSVRAYERDRDDEIDEDDDDRDNYRDNYRDNRGNKRDRGHRDNESVRSYGSYGYRFDSNDESQEENKKTKRFQKGSKEEQKDPNPPQKFKILFSPDQLRCFTSISQIYLLLKPNQQKLSSLLNILKKKERINNFYHNNDIDSSNNNDYNDNNDGNDKNQNNDEKDYDSDDGLGNRVGVRSAWGGTVGVRGRPLAPEFFAPPQVCYELGLS